MGTRGTRTSKVVASCWRPEEEIAAGEGLSLRFRKTVF